MTRVRIMLVEDESMVALMMEDLLGELGCEVVASFASLAPAIAWLEEGTHRLDGALLDVNLGGQMVYPLAIELARRGIPFAFATGYGGLSDERFADAAIVRKPVDLGKLTPVVELFGKAG